MFCASFPIPCFVALFAKQLPDNLNSSPSEATKPITENRGGVENTGNICNSVICYKLW